METELLIQSLSYLEGGYQLYSDSWKTNAYEVEYFKGDANETFISKVDSIVQRLTHFLLPIQAF